MWSARISAGVLAGLAAGLVFGVMMTVMTAPTPQETRVPMMVMVAQVVGSQSLLVGWIYHLFNSAVIGAIFGVLIGSMRTTPTTTAGFAGWGAAYGFAWWILGGLILMPIMLGMQAFAPVLMPMMRGVAMASLIGHLIFGLILGWLYPTFSVRVGRTITA
jgi:hypothetical protein